MPKSLFSWCSTCLQRKTGLRNGYFNFQERAHSHTLNLIIFLIHTLNNLLICLLQFSILLTWIKSLIVKSPRWFIWIIHLLYHSFIFSGYRSFLSIRMNSKRGYSHDQLFLHIPFVFHFFSFNISQTISS